MTQHRVVTDRAARQDIASAARWYEQERPGLGAELTAELRATQARIAHGPSTYPLVGSGIRRALVRRFPYAIYFTVEADLVRVFAVLHSNRDPEIWLRRGRQRNT